MIFPSSLYWLTTMREQSIVNTVGTNVKTFVDEQVIHSCWANAALTNGTATSQRLKRWALQI